MRSNILNFNTSIFNSVFLYSRQQVNYFLTDKQKVILGLAFTIFSFLTASYLFHRHWLLHRVVAQYPALEANVNVRLESIFQEHVLRTNDEEKEETLDASTHSVNLPNDILHEILDRGVQERVLSTNDEEREEALDASTHSVNLPNDILHEIFCLLEYDPSVQRVSKQWRGVFEERGYKKFFQSYQDSPFLSALCHSIQAKSHLTEKEKVQELYQTVIDLTLRTEGGGRAKREISSLYSHPLSAERLNHLVRWVQAVNLIKVFTTIASLFGFITIANHLPTAQTFLIGISNKDVLAQAEEIRLWMGSHTTDLARINHLNLSHARLSELPKEIGLLTQLRSLDLYSNQLTALPPEIGQLTHLQSLDLYCNQLTALPPEIGQLTHLKSLDLYCNQLTTLPPEMGQLTSLQELNLCANQLNTLPEMGQLAQLQRLYLNHNRLNTLPEMGQLTQLQRLILNNNQLNTLPIEIGQLTRLQTINLSHNQLNTLPVEIGQLTRLQELDLRNNQLTTLPLEIGQLTHLQKLDLRNNQLTTLPAEMGQLMHLQRLFLDSNQLAASLPARIKQLAFPITG